MKKILLKGRGIYLLLLLFSLMMSSSFSQNTITVKGVVMDGNKEPLTGVSVRLKGNSNIGINTDINGAYKLTNVPSNGTLVFSFIGMITQEVPVKGRTSIDVVLKDNVQELESVVVTAFGTGQKKASLVGAVQAVKPSDLKIPSANLSNSFAGRLAGVIAVQRSGEPGADGSNFWIRGISSVNATSPLIILDGVAISSADLNAIAPEVIDGFSILKDATATALYGSRGANGVVIVTTKTGADLDRPIINFRLESNATTPTSVPKFVDGVQYMELFNEAIGNLSTGDVPYTQDKINGTRERRNPYAYPNVKWYDEIFKNMAFNQKANFNIRGGGKKVDYFMSATIDHQSGILKDISRKYSSFNNQIQYIRYAFQNNLRINFSPTSKISLNLNANIDQSRGPSSNISDIFGNTMNTNPVDFAIEYEPDGKTPYTKWGSKKNGPSRLSNPYAEAIEGYYDDFASTVIANIKFEQDLSMFLEGLRFNARGAFKNWSSTSTIRKRDNNYFSLDNYAVDPATGLYTVNVSRIGDENSTTLKSEGSNNGDRSLYFEAMFLWDKTFGRHDLSAMINYNQDENSTNMADKNILNNLPKRRQGLAARLTYIYDNKYLGEINFGYNGSENFAKGHRFGFFPSIALGYNISEEAFWAPIKPVISYLKFRGTYGLVGNDNIGGNRFVYLSDVELSHKDFDYTTGFNQSYTLKGPLFKRFKNEDITWEIGYKANVGLDMTLFNNIRINVDAFREYRKNIFIERGAVPTYFGTADAKIWGNLAEVENKGMDVAMEYNKTWNDFTLNLKGTFTYATNKIKKWDEPAFLQYPQLSGVGHKLNSHVGYIAERLFIDNAEVKNSPTQMISNPVQAGDIKYKDIADVNGKPDGKIDANDRAYIGQPSVPEIIYGFGPAMKYKDVDFSFFFQGVGNTSLMMSGFHPFGTQSNRNVLQFVADDHWSPTNQDIYAKYPRLTKLDQRNNTVSSTYWLRDASFLKLKDIEFGYTYKNMRFSISGHNLLTISKFKHWDPEMGGGSGLKYPTMRTFNIGFQMTFK